MPSVYTFRLIVWGILLVSVSLSGQDLCQILGITRSQVVPPSAAPFQAFLGGFNGSSSSLGGVGYRIEH